MKTTVKLTKTELNRDIKWLHRLQAKAKDNESVEKYYKLIEEEVKPEFMRLYRADSKIEQMNFKSFKMMYRMNLSHRFVPLHMFAIGIEIKITK